MNKKDLVTALSRDTNRPLAYWQDFTNVMFEAIMDKLLAGGRVEIRGFGAFSVKSRGSYVGRNPKTGASVDVGEKRVVAFRTGKDLFERMQKKRK